MRTRRAPTSTTAVLLAVATVTTTRLPVFLVATNSLLMLDELGNSAVSLGACLAVFYLAASPASLPAGRFATTYGARAGIRVGGVLSLTCLIGIATLADSWAAVIGFLVLGGIGSAFVEPAINLSLFHLVPHRRQGLAFALKQSANPLAVTLGSLAVPLFAAEYGWRWSFACAAALACASMVSTARLALPTVEAGSARRLSGGGTERTLLAYFGLLGALGAVVGNAVGGFAPGALELTGMAETSIGLLIGLCGLGTVGVRLAFGMAADRGAHVTTCIVALLVVGSIGCAFMALGGLPLTVAGCVAAFVGGWGWAGLLHLQITRFFGSDTGLATGIVMTGASVGSGLGPLVFGISLVRLGHPASWAWVAVLGVVALGLALRTELLRGRASATSPSRPTT